MNEIIQKYVPLKYINGNGIGICPVCKSDVLVTTDTSYECFNCGIKGPNEDFVKLVTGIYPKPEIVVTEMFDKICEANRYIIEYAKEQLPAISDYVKERHLSEESIENFEIGYVSYSYKLLDELLRKYSEEVLLETGFFNKSESGAIYPVFTNRMIFPVKDYYGNIIGFGGRSVVESDKYAKYKNSPQTMFFKKHDVLFGMNLAKNHMHNGCIVCEGFMDVIAFHDAGLKNAVASMGTALTREQLLMIRSLTDTLYLCYDSDEAGLKATERAIKLTRNYGFKSVKIIKISDGKDADEVFKAYGDEKLFEYVKNAVPPEVYLAFDLKRAVYSLFAKRAGI